MKKIFYFIMSFFAVTHVAGKAIPDTTRSTPGYFVFKHKISTTAKGIETFLSKTDSVAKTNPAYAGNDSLLEAIRENTKLLLGSLRTEIKLVIEVHNDSIWRQEIGNSIMADEGFQMMLVNSGALHHYTNKKVFRYKDDLFVSGTLYTIEQKKTDRKQIKGFDCFKLIITAKHEDEVAGNSIYEMYVTDKIKLPVHSVINIGKLIPGLFPLEIKIFQEELPGLEDIYEIVELK